MISLINHDDVEQCGRTVRSLYLAQINMAVSEKMRVYPIYPIYPDALFQGKSDLEMDDLRLRATPIYGHHPKQRYHRGWDWCPNETSNIGNLISNKDLKMISKIPRNGTFTKPWNPKMDGLKRKIHLQMDDLGLPPFMETPHEKSGKPPHINCGKTLGHRSWGEGHQQCLRGGRGLRSNHIPR